MWSRRSFEIFFDFSHHIKLDYHSEHHQSSGSRIELQLQLEFTMSSSSSNSSSTPRSNSSTIAKLLAYRLTSNLDSDSHSSTSLEQTSSDLRFRFTNHYQPWNSSLTPNLNLLPRFTNSTPPTLATTPSTTSTSSSIPPAQCPMSKDQHLNPNNGVINPLNQMPNLSQTALSKSQKMKLSTQRTVSSIPKSSASPSNSDASPYDKGNESACPVPHDQRSASQPSPIGTKEVKSTSSDKWEYPSPQQFYNALVRKGWATPEDSVETMVLIHNVLNERAWDEVIRWERELVPDW